MIEKAPAVPPQWAKLHRGSAAVLLGTEAAALRHLRKVVADVIARMVAQMVSLSGQTPQQVRQHAILLIHHTTAELSHEVQGGVVDARQKARLAALKRLSVELEQVRLEARLSPHNLAAPSLAPRPEDRVVASQLGASFSAAWGALALRKVLLWSRDPSASLPAAIARTAPESDSRLKRIATTEVARAYSSEHDEGVGYVAETHKTAEWIPALFRRWDATLDRKTCPVCRSHDGEMVLAGLSFPGGESPGDVHANCRCFPTLIFFPLRITKTSPGHYTGLDEDQAA